ncbi:ATP dependent DNA ligase [Anaerovorax odorimutans]|uniref:ATP dependent DNA ligase n=1 Tax=Anaerovorax odorimutans TaxID=109327 RepID=UPI00041D2479|nr:hypothetical protein [Anaerovorax odorimutans]
MIKLIRFSKIKISPPFLNIPKRSNNKNVAWIVPTLLCTVKYMQKTSSASLRQPVFKGLGRDKETKDCKIKN